MFVNSPSTVTCATFTAMPGSSTTQNLVEGVIVPAAFAAIYVENPSSYNGSKFSIENELVNNPLFVRNKL